MHHDQPELFLGIQGWFNILKATSVVQNINKLKKKNYAISSVEQEKQWTKFNIYARGKKNPAYEE